MGKNNLTSPQEEAVSILGESLFDLTSPNRDLKSILRKCQHVCELLGWDQQKRWFHRELNGYYKDANLPSYRKIAGTRKWDASGSAYDRSKWFSEEMVYGVDPELYEEEADTFEVWAGIDWILSASQIGCRVPLEETKIVSSSSGRRTFTLQRVRIFTAPSIAASLSQIEKAVYDFVSSAYVQLKYGNFIRDIWNDYRILVDKALSQLELTQHLSAIETNLLSTNAEAGRSAAFECRNLLNDLANQLWRDSRGRYEHLLGNTDDGKLDVSQGMFGNRLAAYLHQKGISGTRGKYLRNEAVRLSASIRSLIAYQSEAHEPINLQTARSIAIATYVLIGEIVMRTDLVPVEMYGTPEIDEESAS